MGILFPRIAWFPLKSLLCSQGRIFLFGLHTFSEVIQKKGVEGGKDPLAVSSNQIKNNNSYKPRKGPSFEKVLCLIENKLLSLRQGFSNCSVPWLSWKFDENADLDTVDFMWGWHSYLSPVMLMLLVQEPLWGSQRWSTRGRETQQMRKSTAFYHSRFAWENTQSDPEQLSSVLFTPKSLGFVCLLACLALEEQAAESLHSNFREVFDLGL